MNKFFRKYIKLIHSFLCHLFSSNSINGYKAKKLNDEDLECICNAAGHLLGTAMFTNNVADLPQYERRV